MTLASSSAWTSQKILPSRASPSPESRFPLMVCRSFKLSCLSCMSDLDAVARGLGAKVTTARRGGD